MTSSASGGSTVLSFDGGTWAPILLLPTGVIHRVSGNGDYLLAVGDAIWEYDGAEWVEHDIESSGIGVSKDAHLRPDGSMLVVGDGSFLFSGAGAHSAEWTWAADNPGFIWDANESLAISRNELLFVGEELTGGFPFFNTAGRAGHLKDGTFVQFNLTRPLNDLWSADSGASAVAVGNNGSIQRFDGTAWTADTSPVTENLEGLWGSAADNILAVGAAGTILRYTTSWVAETNVPTTNELRGIIGFAANDVFAVGTLGTLMHFDGAQWTLIDTGSSENFNDIWGTDSSNLHVATEQGSVLHYDGVSWTTQSLSTQPILQLKGVESGEMFAAGGAPGNGLLWGYDGTRWSQINARIDVGSPQYVKSATPIGNDVYFAGQDGYFARLIHR